VTTLAGNDALIELAPGSYRLRIERDGYAGVFYPLVVPRGEPVAVEVALPPAGDVPPDLHYVPEGRFLYGDYDDDLRLSFLNTVPMHQRSGRGFLIAAHETTFADWIAFLSALPPAERDARRPNSNAVQGSVALTQDRGGRWSLRLSV